MNYLRSLKEIELLYECFSEIKKDFSIHELRYLEKWLSLVDCDSNSINTYDNNHNDNYEYNDKPAIKKFIFQGLTWFSLINNLAKTYTKSKKNYRLSVKLEHIKDNQRYLSHKKTSEKLKIAMVADEFTADCFSYDANVFQLSFIDFRAQLESFKPDLVFIESAWFGFNKTWKDQYSVVGKKIFDLISYCHSMGILVVYWAKEDPIHYYQFLPIAKKADIVFTTDHDCISKYKKILHHGNIYLLPFAAQTAIHNPIENFTRKDKFFFAGAYYFHHHERQSDFTEIFNRILIHKDIDIYDRNYLSDDIYNPPFPSEYDKFIVGKLQFKEVSESYKNYEYAINVNTVKHSSTMCSRRVFELMASNTLVVSNYAKAFSNLLNVGFVCSKDIDGIETYVNRISTDRMFAKRVKLHCLRTILHQHTYFDRMRTIKSVVSGIEYEQDLPHIAIFSVVNNVFEFIDLRFKCQLQSYQKSTLYILNLSEIRFNINDNKIKEYNNISDLIVDVLKNKDGFITYFANNDYYGENYLLDIALSTKYSDAIGIGKGTYLWAKNKASSQYKHKNKTYCYVQQLEFRRAVFGLQFISAELLSKWLNDPENAYLSFGKLLSIDEFNYCQNGLHYYFVDKTKNLVRDLDFSLDFNEL